MVPCLYLPGGNTLFDLSLPPPRRRPVLVAAKMFSGPRAKLLKLSKLGTGSCFFWDLDKIHRTWWCSAFVNFQASKSLVATIRRVNGVNVFRVNGVNEWSIRPSLPSEYVNRQNEPSCCGKNPWMKRNLWIIRPWTEKCEGWPRSSKP